MTSCLCWSERGKVGEGVGAGVGLWSWRGRGDSVVVRGVSRSPLHLGSAGCPIGAQNSPRAEASVGWKDGLSQPNQG